MDASTPLRRWFSPDGRIGPEGFLHGWLFVFGVQALCGAALMAAPIWAGLPLAAISLVAAWAGICLIAMRFHDAGLSGWLAAPVALGGVILAWLLARAAGVTPRMGGLLDLSFSVQNGQTLSAAAQAAARDGFALTLAINFAVCAAIGLALAWQREDGRDNRHGVQGAQLGPLGD